MEQSTRSQIPALGPWVMSMKWVGLLFAHWKVPAHLLRPFIPSGVQLDLYNGEAWLGVVPFQMYDTRARFLPAVPSTANFFELNLRTYVTDGSRAGVFFFSLDATSRLAVFGARNFFCLPYFNATIVSKEVGGEIEYRSLRHDKRAPPATLDCRYAPIGAVEYSTPGSLEEWLTERYYLYTALWGGKAALAQVYHSKWPLQKARVSFNELDMTRIVGVDLPREPDHVLFSRTLSVTATRLYSVKPVVC